VPVLGVRPRTERLEIASPSFGFANDRTCNGSGRDIRRYDKHRHLHHAGDVLEHSDQFRGPSVEIIETGRIVGIA
jgi:hypothetical protein